MPNKIEYSIAFDTDTQQDVVLVRKNTNQAYQKYVFDEKLDRFEKLPEEKKEDKSEISTPQFLPLKSQESLTDPVSEPLIFYSYRFCFHYSRILIFAFKKTSELQLLLTADSLVQVKCDNCTLTKSTLVRNGVIFTCQDGILFKFEENGRKVMKLDKELKVFNELPIQMQSENVKQLNGSVNAGTYDERSGNDSDEDACSDDSFSTAPELERTSSPGSDDFEMLTASGKKEKVEISQKPTSDIDDKPCYGSYHPNEDNKESDAKSIEQKGQGIAQEAGPEPHDNKNTFSDLKNDHHQSSTAALNYASPVVAATKVQETGTTVYHLLAARNSAKNAAIYARKRSNVGFEGFDAESTRTALEPSDFDSEDSEFEDESYDDSEYSDEEEEESGSDGNESMDQESSDIASGAQDKVQKPGKPASDSCQEQEQGDAQEPAVANSGPKTDNQDLEKLASGHQNAENPGDVKESQADQSTATSSTRATVPEAPEEQPDESEYSDEEEDESYDESDYSDEEEEESEGDEDQKHSEDSQKASATASGPEKIESSFSDLKNVSQEPSTTASNASTAATDDQEIKSCSADLKNSHQDPTATASNPPPPAAATADQMTKIKASSPTLADDDVQKSTTTAIEPSDVDSEDSDVEDESYDDSEYSDEDEEEYSDEEDEDEEESDASMNQEPSANVQHSEKNSAETVTATGVQDIRSDLKNDNQVTPPTASDPAMLVTATNGLETKIETSRFESQLLVTATDAQETSSLTPSPIGAAPLGQQEVMTTTSSTPAVPEPSDHESEESDVEDESEYDSEYSDEEEEGSDDESDYSDEEEEESDGLEEQEQPGVAQKPSDTASGPEDTKSVSSDPKNNHQVPKPTVAATNNQETKVAASSHSKAKVDDQISVKTALEPSECDSDESEYDSDCSDEEEEESDSDKEQEQPADTASGPEDTKSGLSDLKNSYQQSSTAASNYAAASTKVQETGTTVYHLLAARNVAKNAAMFARKHSNVGFEGSDAESTRTALEPSDFDSEDSEVEDESYDESDYSEEEEEESEYDSDKEEEESGSDGEESMGQGQPGDGQEPSGAQDKDQKPREPVSGNQETGEKRPSSSGKKKSGSVEYETFEDPNDPYDSDSDVSDEDSEYSDEEEEYSDEEEEEESETDAPMDQEPSENVRPSENITADVQESGTSKGSETSTTVTVLSNDIFPICLKQCPQLRQFILHALNLLTQEIGAYILGKDGNLEEVRTPLKLNFRNYSEFKKGDWVIGNGEVNYELDANSRLQKLEYSKERKTFVKCEHGVVRMLAQKEVNAQPAVLRGTEAMKTDSGDSKVNDEESDSEIENESDGSEETGDDMEDEEVSDEENPFVYNPGARQEEPEQADPDESLLTARGFRFRAPFLQAVNLNDTANMSDIPLTSPDESFAETSGDDSQYCVMTNDDVLLTKHQKDPNQACCIS
ncbi:hypothetical protein CAEBREN_10145 [Caenorhabditis brenneri]|uniref:Uncharacterized protein n=1 Tax=Caenorhabditis brenneri TaxID=135651 RepID=G0NCN3_CAEBE|nr:hypothetical protein CAEBREN_10145 [Caenorhabditis brenneri]